MKVGLLARADDRGLGHMTWDFYRNLHPERTVVVDMATNARGFAQHLDRYPDADRATFADGVLEEGPMRDMLADVDVLYSAETFYDDRLPEWAEHAGTATVLHVMPEFYRGQQATVLWAPTSWRVDRLPPHRAVPVPVDPPFAAPYRPWDHDERLHVLHVAGNPAASDRNGTRYFLNALRHVRADVEVHVVTQAPRLPSITTSRSVSYRRVIGGVADRWAMYQGADLMVLPRRYGGLCLPALEAMASGVAVAMPDCSPNSDWPVTLMPATSSSTIETPAGQVPMYDVSPRTIANLIDRFAVDQPELAAARHVAWEWSRGHTWGELVSLYRAELQRAVA